MNGGNVDYHEVLHVGGAKFTACETLGKIGSSLHLVRGDASPQCHRSHVRKTVLLLGMNADVVAIHIVRWIFFNGRVQVESNAILQFIQEALGRPAVTEEQEFQASSLAMLAQYVRIAEQFCDALHDGQHLIPAHKGVKPRSKIRLSRKATCYPN